MPEPVATWSNEQYGCPMDSSAALTQHSGQRPGQPLSGPFRYRRVTELPEVSGTIRIVQTGAQFLAFESFYNSILDRGIGWFNIDLYRGTTLTTFIAHFTAGYQHDVIRGEADYGITSFELVAFTRSSVPYINPGADIIDAGTATNPSPEGDLIEAGTALNPSNPDPLIFGGVQVGRKHSHAS